MNVLVCNHKLCDECYNTKTSGHSTQVIVCPIKSCGIRSIRPTAYRSIKDILVSSDQQQILQSVEEYQKGLDEQELNLNDQINKLKREIESTTIIVNESKGELDQLYEERLNELKAHFKSLEDNLIEQGMRRKEQFSCLVGLIQDMKDLLRNQRQLFVDILRENVDSLNICERSGEVADLICKNEPIETETTLQEMLI